MQAQTAELEAESTSIPHSSGRDQGESVHRTPHSDEEARRERNRRNAQKSTGPRTEAGKARSSKNAVKHGLLARQVVITEGDGQEDAAEFDALVAETRDIYQPADARQDALVHKIAACTWRLARAHRFEVGAIRRGLDHVDAPGRDVAAAQRYLDEHAELLDSHRQTLEWFAEHPDFDVQAVLNAPALLYALPAVSERLGVPARMAKLADQDFRPMIVEAQAAAVERDEDTLADLEDRLRQAEEVDQLRRSRDRLFHALPDPESIKQLVRYETMIDRELTRAIAQLDRLQKEATNERPVREPVEPPDDSPLTTHDSPLTPRAGEAPNEATGTDVQSRVLDDLDKDSPSACAKQSQSASDAGLTHSAQTAENEAEGAEPPPFEELQTADRDGI